MPLKKKKVISINCQPAPANHTRRGSELMHMGDGGECMIFIFLLGSSEYFNEYLNYTLKKNNNPETKTFKAI